MTISGSGLTRSVHCGGTDHTVAPSPCSKRRSPYRLYRLPTQGSCRPNNGWNGCVTRTNCRAASEESAFSVEVQAVGARPVPVAERGRWRGDDLSGATRLSTFWDRLAPSARELASDLDGMRILLAAIDGCVFHRTVTDASKSLPTDLASAHAMILADARRAD